MYTIAGTTGHVGSATVEHLLAAGAPVRALVRDETRAEGLAAAGAEVAVVDLHDRDGLAAAIDDSQGFFALLPFDPSAADFHAEIGAMVASITGAVGDSEVPHVVALSSWGAELPADTGPIVGLHHFENQLRATGTTVTALRAPHFQEKVGEVLDGVRHTGVYPVFASSADVAKPMIATRDIGEVAARALLSPPPASEVVALHGPTYTERQVADRLAVALGWRLEVVTIPESGWVDALVEAGLSRHIAGVLAGLYAADEHGRLVPRGDRTVHGTTEIDDTLSALVSASA